MDRTERQNKHSHIHFQEDPGFLQKVPGSNSRNAAASVAMIRPTECTGAPSLSGASAMQHIQPLSEVQHSYAEQGLIINVRPSQSTDEPKGARHGRIYLFTPSERTGNVGQRRAARTDPLQLRPCRVKCREPLRLRLSLAPAPQTRAANCDDDLC